MNAMTRSCSAAASAQCATRLARRCWAAVAILTFVSGCGSYSFYSTEVAFSLDNRTDAVLCYFPSRQDAASARCLQQLDAGAEKQWLPGCGRGTKDEVAANPISVVITTKDGGRQIYSRTATCGEWKDTDRTFVIEQEGDVIMVTDGFGDVTRSP